MEIGKAWRKRREWNGERNAARGVEGEGSRRRVRSDVRGGEGEEKKDE